MGLLQKIFGSKNQRELKKLQPIVDRDQPSSSRRCKAKSDAELKAMTAEFKQKLDNGATLDDILPEAFAVVPRGRRARARHAPLRRADDRRHGPAPGPDRRDAHRRRQDARRDAARAT